MPHWREVKKYLDDNGIKYRLTNAKMQRSRKVLGAIAHSVPALKIGNEIMIGWNLNNFKKLYTTDSKSQLSH